MPVSQQRGLGVNSRRKTWCREGKLTSKGLPEELHSQVKTVNDLPSRNLDTFNAPMLSTRDYITGYILMVA